MVSGVVLMVLYGSGGSGGGLIGPMGSEAALTAAQPSTKHKRSFTDNLHSGIKLASSIFGRADGRHDQCKRSEITLRLSSRFGRHHVGGGQSGGQGVRQAGGQQAR